MALPGFQKLSNIDDKHAPQDKFPIPSEIKKERLHANGKLITAEQYEKIKLILKDKSNGRYSKELFKDIGVNYGIIKGDKGIYVIYNDNKTPVYIGHGAFSSPKVAQLYESGGWYSLKSQVVENLNAALEEKRKLKVKAADVMKEHYALRHLGRSPEVVFERQTKNPQIKKANILMEYVFGQSLSNIRSARINETKVLKDIEYLEMLDILFEDYYQNIFLKGLFHCDIKASNARYDFMTKQGKLLDFGFARGYQGQPGLYKSTVARGTPGYQAPEITFKHDKPEYVYSEKSEVFAWGALFRMFLFNERMFLTQADTSPCFQPVAKTIFSEDQQAVVFVGTMLAVDPESRPDLKSVGEFLYNLRMKHMPVTTANTAAICAGLNCLPTIATSASVPAPIKKLESPPLVRAADQVPVTAVAPRCEALKSFHL